MLQSGAVVQESDYDGLGRRIVKQVKNSADLDATYHYHLSRQSVVEVRNGSDATLKEYVWRLTYIDELVQTAINDDPADGTERVCESAYWALQDGYFLTLCRYVERNPLRPTWCGGPRRGGGRACGRRATGPTAEELPPLAVWPLPRAGTGALTALGELRD